LFPFVLPTLVRDRQALTGHPFQSILGELAKLLECFCLDETGAICLLDELEVLVQDGDLADGIIR
jgi:hypothetical protein